MAALHLLEMHDDLVFESTRTMTQAAFPAWLRARERWDPLNHFELLNGRVVMTPPAGYPHGEIESNVILALGNFVRAGRLGRVFGSSQGYALPTGDTLEPDAAYISNARWAAGPRATRGKFLRIVPDLVVEILSKGTALRDRSEKKAAYLKSGVCEYWIVDPRSRAVTVLAGPDWKQERLFGERDRLRSEVLPGLEVPVAEILVD
jgi:Uma2 family endonuclease